MIDRGQVLLISRSIKLPKKECLDNLIKILKNEQIKILSQTDSLIKFKKRNVWDISILVEKSYCEGVIMLEGNDETMIKIKYERSNFIKFNLVLTSFYVLLGILLWIFISSNIFFLPSLLYMFLIILAIINPFIMYSNLIHTENYFGLTLLLDLTDTIHE